MTQGDVAELRTRIGQLESQVAAYQAQAIRDAAELVELYKTQKEVNSLRQSWAQRRSGMKQKYEAIRADERRRVGLEIIAWLRSCPIQPNNDVFTRAVIAELQQRYVDSEQINSMNEHIQTLVHKCLDNHIARVRDAAQPSRKSQRNRAKAAADLIENLTDEDIDRIIADLRERL